MQRDVLAWKAGLNTGRLHVFKRFHRLTLASTKFAAYPKKCAFIEAHVNA
jgi:hypothetical protein